MKKLFSLFLVSLLLVSCAALAEEESWYLKTARELTLCVGELARDESYLELLSGSHFPCMDPLKTADFENILSAWQYEVPPLKGVLTLLGLVEGAQLSPTAMEYFDARMPAMIVSMYSGSYSAEAVAAASMLSYSRSYILPEAFKPCIIALELDSGAIAVSFSQTGEDTITATACPLFAGDGADYGEVVQSLNRTFPIMKKTQSLSSQ